MSRAKKIFGFKPPLPSSLANSTNREGYPAWMSDLESQFLSTLLTNTLGHIFYSKSEEMIGESETIHSQMLQADPAFYARALGFARNQGYMRLQPIYGLARLAVSDSTYRALFPGAFDQVILTPADLLDFWDIYCGLTGDKTGGQMIKKTVGKWLVKNLTPYWVMKYGGNRAEGISLRDVIIITHPRMPNKSGNNLFKYILNKKRLVESDLPEQLFWFEKLKKAKTDEEKIEAITKGKIPFKEAVLFAGNSQRVWDSMVPQFTVMNIVRNLEALRKHGVLENHSTLIASRLSDRDAIQKSKILPYQIFRAFQNVPEGWARDALRDAMDSSFDGIPFPVGDTFIALDTSYSMVNTPDLWDTARIYAVALARNNPARVLYTFDSSVGRIGISGRDSLLTQAMSIEGSRDSRPKDRDILTFTTGTPHGTWTSGPLEWMIQGGIQANNLVIITDGQQNQGRPLFDAVSEYRRRNPRMRLFMVDVSPYNNAIAPVPDPLNYYLYGWSDNCLRFIKLMSGELTTMAEAIRQGKSPTTENFTEGE